MGAIETLYSKKDYSKGEVGFLEGFLKENLKQELMEAFQMGKHKHIN